jgi:hypothetical protein
MENRSFGLELEDLLSQLRVESCIHDVSRAHQVQHPAVLRNFVLLELIDGVLPVVHSDELEQHVVLLDHFVVLRNVLLQGQDVGLL